METAANVIFQICDGLEDLHSEHIIHRDLKLENVMFNDGKIKIVDLGCSNYYGEGIDRNTRIGTRPCMSPEAVSSEKQDDRSDIWSLGVILYEILTK
jgi:serine/threonine protein kinase